MRPLRITMTAFGPYKDTEVIDFAELNEHRLFVISGNTGAGKTSIFDAICFALYGEASGEDRSDKSMLRSHFADEGVYTSVEFEFELKGRTYRVLRQLAHVKAGNKNPAGDKYEFYEITGGKEVPMTDRMIVSQVDERIQQVIGLTKDQFSQIVMLPQGEFRKLLTSETENKEEILRRIFKTSLYKIVSEMLNDRRKESQKMYDERAKVREIYINQVKAAFGKREGSDLQDVFGQEHYNTFQVLEALEKEISFHALQIKQHKASLEAETASYQIKLAGYHQAQALNEQFNDLEQKRSRRDELERKIPEMDAKRRKLQLAEKAVQLEVYEQQCQEAVEYAKMKAKLLVEAAEELKLAELSLAAANKSFTAEDNNAGMREQTVRELERLQGFEPIVKEISRRKQLLDQLSAETASLSAQLLAVGAELEGKQAERVKLANQVTALEDNVRVLPHMIEQLSDMKEKAIMLRDYIKLHSEADNGRIEEANQRAIYEHAEKEYTALEERWVEGQAGILANHLHDGKPCPVCGSAEHPLKAVLTANVPTKEEMDRKRQEKAQSDQAYHTIKAKLEVTIRQLKEKEEELTSKGLAVGGARDQFNSLLEAGKTLDAKIKRLKEEQEKLEQQKKGLRELEELLEVKQKEKDHTTVRHNERNAALATEKALYEQAIFSIPENIRSLERLMQQIRSTLEQKQQLEARWKQAQEQYQKANERRAKASSNLSNAEAQRIEADAKQGKAQSSFAAALVSAGFESVEAYQQVKMSTAGMTALKQELELYTNSLAAIRMQAAELEASLNGKARVDLVLLKQGLAALEQSIEAIRGMYLQAQNDYEKAIECKSNILQADEQLKETEQQLQTVKDLYDVVRGENSRKISFERYLQIEFLENIIQAANQRLQRISNGQYYLVRSDRLEKHRRQGGLGLDVYDNYTGLMRDVKTLSGGEKFNASLCLALGMADVIQAYEGGITLETMFIDEGFGSLDEESLNKAIDTLVDLQQSGRMIGIISHVQELKQAIPAILEVRKTKEGHSYTQFMVR